MNLAFLILSVSTNGNCFPTIYCRRIFWKQLLLEWIVQIRGPNPANEILSDIFQAITITRNILVKYYTSQNSFFFFATFSYIAKCLQHQTKEIIQW